MFWSCFSCLLNKQCKFLPDDLLVNILCRLPAEDLLRCKQVCSKWNCLISTPRFNNMNVNCGAAVPITVVEEFNMNESSLKIVFMNDWYKKRHGILRRSRRIRRSYTCKLLSSPRLTNRTISYHGLLLVRHHDLEHRHIIVNPITGVQVTFHIRGGTIVALFFHPVDKEYYAIGTRFLGTRKLGFKLITLAAILANRVGFKMGWKKLNYKVPMVSPCPIVKTDAIYWMVQEDNPEYDEHTRPVACCGVYVIIFDIKKEEFRVISHPGPRCDNNQSILNRRRALVQMDLVEKEDVLSFYAISFLFGDIVKIQLWDLEDQYSWSQSCETITLTDMSIQRFPFTNGDRNFRVKLIGTINGELIISWLWRGVFAYHLLLKTLRKLEYDAMGGSHALIHNKTTLSPKGVRN